MSTATEPLARSSKPIDVDTSARFLDEALARAASDRRVAVVRIPAPAAPLDAILRGARRGTALFWQPPTGPAIAGLGAAVEITVRGPQRWDGVESARREVFSHLSSSAHPACPPAPARLYGGFAFAPQAADAAPWTGFDDAHFVLPRWTYERVGSEGCLTFAADARDGWDGRAALVRAELARLWELLQNPRHQGSAPELRAIHHQERDRWDAQIRAITDAIAEGHVEKIVAARRSVATAAKDLDPWTILDALASAYPDTWRFALRFGSSATFVGATPERLFKKRSLVIEADSLAGTIDARIEGAAEQLLTSDKDRREHAWVTQHLEATLRERCSHLEVPAEPQIRALPNVLHLHTPLRGTLRPEVGAIELARILFPTPAVGGVPTPAAISWIESQEEPRGWYSGPVGWIDEDGDAELAVALRCGVLSGSRAWLYSGCGVVRGSRPEAEWDETAVKLLPLLRALGAEGNG
ncbi:MAG: isochorismate synthase MenF [Sandaracinaceae bacterium]